MARQRGGLPQMQRLPVHGGHQPPYSGHFGVRDEAAQLSGEQSHRRRLGQARQRVRGPQHAERRSGGARHQRAARQHPPQIGELVRGVGHVVEYDDSGDMAQRLAALLGAEPGAVGERIDVELAHQVLEQVLQFGAAHPYVRSARGRVPEEGGLARSAGARELHRRALADRPAHESALFLPPHNKRWREDARAVGKPHRSRFCAQGQAGDAGAVPVGESDAEIAEDNSVHSSPWE